MKTLKQGTHRLFQHGTETAATVSRMLLDLEKNGMNAVRRYREQFDEWSPASFRLGPKEIRQAEDQLCAVAI